MIRPPSFIIGSAFCTVKNTPRALVSKVRSKCSAVTAPVGAISAKAALAKTMSIFTSRDAIRLYSRSRSCRSPASPGTAIAFGPICATAATNASSRRPVMNTWAPSATKRWAVASPMPLLPPVMTATLPAKAGMTSVLKPAGELLVLLLGERRVEVLDRDVGRGDQDRLQVRERVEAVLAVVVAHPSRPRAAERHGLHEQVDV